MNHYELLKIPQDSSPEDIKKAFRKLALEFHPDVNNQPGAMETFKKITESYKILIDPKKRSEYDLKFTINERALKRKKGWTIVHVEQEYKPYYPTKAEEAEEIILRRKQERKENSLNPNGNPNANAKPKTEFEKNHEEQIKIYKELLRKLNEQLDESKREHFKIFDVENDGDVKKYNEHNPLKPTFHPHNRIDRPQSKPAERKPNLSFSNLPKDNTNIR